MFSGPMMDRKSQVQETAGGVEQGPKGFLRLFILLKASIVLRQNDAGSWITVPWKRPRVEARYMTTGPSPEEVGPMYLKNRLKRPPTSESGQLVDLSGIQSRTSKQGRSDFVSNSAATLRAGFFPCLIPTFPFVTRFFTHF